MKKEKIKKLELESQIYKRIIKGRRTIYWNNADNFEGPFEKRQVIMLTCGEKKHKAKIISLYEAQNYEELQHKLKHKKKYLYPQVNKIEENFHEVRALAFKYKHHYLLKLLILLIIVAALILLFFYGNRHLSSQMSAKFNEKLATIKQEEIYYVVVEINPAIILEMQNNVIIKTACLNDDCVTIYENLDITNKSLNEGVTMLISKAQEKGIDTNNGVKISSRKDVQETLQGLDNIEYEEIDTDAEKTFIAQIVDDENITDESDDYNTKLLKMYESDRDYGKLYQCVIDDQNLKCYITADFEAKLSEELTMGNALTIVNYHQNLMRVLDKFNIKYKKVNIEGLEGLDLAVRGIYIDGVLHNMVTSSAYNCYAYRKYHIDTYSSDDTLDLEMTILPFDKLNLVDLSYDNADVISLNAGVHPDIEVEPGCSTEIMIPSQ